MSTSLTNINRSLIIQIILGKKYSSFSLQCYKMLDCHIIMQNQFEKTKLFFTDEKSAETKSSL